jgi:glutamate-5-semialdehyde dehydrogenase
VLSTLWPSIANSLLDANVQLLCDAPSLSIIQQNPHQKFETKVRRSKDEDYSTEHLSLTLSVLSVPSLSDAIKHINSHSSHHTDSIVTESEQNASTFIRGVDSAGAFWNASTRFADGFRYGFGTEVGISTGRIHARGPVGLEGLVSYKYVLRSKSDTGHIVSEFGNDEGKKKFKHAEIKTDSLPF